MFQEISQNVPGNHSKCSRKSLKMFQEITQNVHRISLKVIQDIAQGDPGNHSRWSRKTLKMIQGNSLLSRKTLLIFQESQMFQEISQNGPGTLKRQRNHSECSRKTLKNVPGYHSRFTRISFMVIQENALNCYTKSLNVPKMIQERSSNLLELFQIMIRKFH